MYRWQKMLLSRIARIRPMKWDIYAPLYDLAQARCSYFQNQPPRLVVLTSEADYATKYAFPAGRIFSTLFETHGTINRNDCNLPLSYYSEGAADRQTVGHFEPLQSHELHPISASMEPAYDQSSQNDLGESATRRINTIWQNRIDKSEAHSNSQSLPECKSR